MTKTRQEAIATQRNPVIRRALERMTDEQYATHRAEMDKNISSGAVDRTIKALVREIVR